MEATPKNTQMRLSQEERNMITQIGMAYHQKNVTDTVRMMTRWFWQNRPAIVLAPEPQKKIRKKVSESD